MNSVDNQFNKSNRYDTLNQLAKESFIYPKFNLSYLLLSMSVIGNSMALNLTFKNPVAKICRLSLGLFWPYVIGKECWSLNKCWNAHRQIEQINNEKVALILQPKELNLFCCESFSWRWYRIENLTKAGYKPVFIKISSTNELNEIIESLKVRNNTIQLLWMNVHGTSKSIKISSGERIDINFCNEKFNAALGHLDSPVTVILESCSTANSEITPNPFAQILADRLPKGSKVIAPKGVIFCSGTSITQHKPFTIEFHKGYWWYRKFWHDSNITKVYQSTGTDTNPFNKNISDRHEVDGIFFKKIKFE